MSNRIWIWRCEKCGTDYPLPAGAIPPRECSKVIAATTLWTVATHCDGDSFLKVREEKLEAMA